MSDDVKLKPCPFCGSLDVHIVEFTSMLTPDNDFVDVKKGLQIECSKCHLACLLYLLDDDETFEHERAILIDAWNRRVHS